MLLYACVLAEEMARAALVTLTVVSTAPFYTLPITRPAAVFTEVAPSLLRVPADAAPSPGCPALQPGSLALYMSTGYVGLCVANASVLPTAAGAGPLGFDLATCSVPFSGESWRDYPPTGIPRGTEHYRNYDGVMSAVVLGSGSGSASLLLVRHGEHKNELNWANGNLYQGLINDVDARTCSSGFHNGVFSDCQPAYNAFVSGAYLAPFAASTCYGLGALGNASTTDLGPLAWPVDGYLNASRGKASYGVRQPSALAAWDGAPVLMWIDNGFASADVWVARGATANASAPAFAAHSAARGAWDAPLLPPGLAAAGILASLQERSPAGGAGGGAPAFQLAPDAGAVHAAAARLRVRGAPSPYHLVVYDIVNYTQCYGSSDSGRGSSGGSIRPGPIGTRMVQDLLRARACSGGAGGGACGAAPQQCTPPWRLMLRVTADFVAFSEPVELARYAAPGWGAAPLAYPTLLSADGGSGEEVDAEGFFVMGTCAQAGGACGSTSGPQVTVARVAIALQEGVGA